jgi:D-amino peptidase
MRAAVLLFSLATLLEISPLTGPGGLMGQERRRAAPRRPAPTAGKLPPVPAPVQPAPPAAPAPSAVPAPTGTGVPQVAAPAPRDTTPAEAFFGVTEAALAREKLQADMHKTGFTVYIIADMEGLAGAVMNQTEMRPVYRGGHAVHERFRKELTDEVNAAIAGAREAGATQFVVNDGHGGTLFRNTLPEELDPEAILIRGYPKPIVMSTGLNPDVDAIFIVGAHANAGTEGVISHNFAFDSFTINGRVLNEAGIAAFIGGEWGIPLALATGDDVLTAETREMLGPIETVTVKKAYGRSAAAAHSPAKVLVWTREAAARAVKRVRARELQPLVLEKPYRVEFCMRKTYEPWVNQDVAKLADLKPTGQAGCFSYTTSSAEDVGTLLNKVEWVVLKP